VIFSLERLFLVDNDCTHEDWFNCGSTQAVGYLHENHACLVFRGTQQPEDWTVNLKAFLYGSPGRHFGFHRAFKTVERGVLTWLQKTSTYSYAGTITAGHSLGGGIIFERHGQPDIRLLTLCATLVAVVFLALLARLAVLLSLWGGNPLLLNFVLPIPAAYRGHGLRETEMRAGSPPVLLAQAITL
jgi:Lipase (class 3)